MKKFFEYSLWALVFLATAALFSAAVMFLWNAILPGIFALPPINYWQAAGLLALCRILFGGIGGMGRRHGIDRHKNPLRDRWQNMSEEERNDFFKRHGGLHHDHFHGRFSDGTEKEPDGEKK